MFTTITKLPNSILRKNYYYEPQQTSVLYLEQGNITLEDKNGAISCQSGSFIFISPQHIYRVVSTSEHFVLHIFTDDNMQITNEFYNDLNIYLLQDLLLQKVHFQANEQQQRHILQLIEQFHFYNGKSNDFYLKHKLLFSLEVAISIIFFNIIFEKNTHQTKKNKQYENITTDFMRLAIYHFSTERELAFYAQKLNISIRYLSQCVKKNTGKTPMQILHKLLINKAKSLITKTQKSIGEIAYDLSFSTPYAFSKFFKQQVDISPYHFRNKK